MPTETIVYCARHPKEETAITCASCGTPICPRCMVVTPVGMKCPSCGKGTTGLTKVTPSRFLLALVTALSAGAVASLLGSMVFLAIFLSFPYGYFAGGMILKASGMKRGRKMEWLAGAGMVIGALGTRLIPAFAAGFFSAGLQPALAAVGPMLLNPFFWIAAGISTACAVSKIRYL